MVELGLAGRTPKKPRSLTRRGKRPAAPGLVGRKFTAVAPDLRWVGDGTMSMTGEGPLYLATVEDLFGRRLLG
jgi:putative transposase